MNRRDLIENENESGVETAVICKEIELLLMEI